MREVLSAMGDRPPAEVMPELARRAAGHLEARIGLVRTLFLEITGSGPEVGAGRELAMAEGFAAVAAYLLAQMRAGRLRPMNPLLALQMFVGPVMVHLLTRRAIAELMGSPPPLEEAVTELAEGWLRAMSVEG